MLRLKRAGQPTRDDAALELSQQSVKLRRRLRANAGWQEARCLQKHQARPGHFRDHLRRRGYRARF